MSDTHLSRRRFLAGSGVGLGAVLLGTSEVAAERPERYIVGTDSPRATRAAERAADAVHRVLDFGDIGSAVAGTFPKAALDGLRNRPGVRYIERDGTMEAISLDSGDSEVPWGVDRVDAEKAHAGGTTGAGADIGIIDTGIDSDHPDLAANLGSGKAFVKARGSYAEPWDDDEGHGTHCAGTAGAVDDGTGVVGVSTEATLHAVKVLDKNGSGSWSDVAAGIEYVGTQGWDVGSLSLGGGKSQTIEDACQYAANQGVLLVAAAGNDGGDVENSAPATYDSVMAVSATDSNDTLASFSNTGTDIELAAPGVGIYSTYPGGYARLSGTSMACPHVAGAAGLLMKSGYTSTQARDQLKNTAEDIGLASSEQGKGLLDAEAAVGSVDDVNEAPALDWVTPVEGDTVGGTTTVELAATDDRTADGSLTVEWRVGDGAVQTASYDSDTGTYTDTWDTAALTDGDYVLTAEATDESGTTTSTSVTVTVDNTSEAPTASIGSVKQPRSRNPHAEFEVSWTASGADLSTVELSLTQTTPRRESEETVTLDASGGAASGTTTLKAKKDDGTANGYDVTVTATDASGEADTATTSVTEDGQ